jgi:lipopolysaccharide/colanic/teichoic acid biosynthesis glycosyltransferase
MADETLSDDRQDLRKHSQFSLTVPSSAKLRQNSANRVRKVRTSAANRILTARRLRKATSRYSVESRPQYKERPVQQLAKRTFDGVASLAGLVLLAPLLAGVAVAVKLTSNGPVLFRQTRLGLNGQPFSILKFRTMYVDRCDASGLKHTVAGDPRVTPIGRFLRRSSIDELPQLINVLRGHMSLVGPRPYVPGMQAGGVAYERLDYRYYDRLRVLPGITGLAQVNGYRGDATDEEAARVRLEYDLAYIENTGLLLDIKIIFRTVIREFFKGSGA